MHLLAMIVVFLISGFTAAHAAPEKKIVEFQIYDGNETLPPQYQKVKTIRGKIGADSISVQYKRREGGKKVEKELSVKGDLFKRCLKVIGRTKLQTSAPAMGAGSFDVTLIDDKGKNENGVPSNDGDWRLIQFDIDELADKSPQEKDAAPKASEKENQQNGKSKI